jgi:uncharacterized damage-inducible protein DinB
MTAQLMKDLLRGRGAHADPLASTSGLGPDLAGRRLPGLDHTIWQLVWHMNYWMDYELSSIAGPEVAYPEHAAVSWPVEPGPPSAGAWEAEVGRFEELLGRLAQWADRAERGEGGRIVHPKKAETVHDVLWQMVAHNSYHVGQVVMLRQALGVWPPARGGGDTW